MNEKGNCCDIATELKKLLHRVNELLEDRDLTDNEKKLITIINEEKLKANKLYQENIYLKSKLQCLIEKDTTDEEN
ncbi:MAG: hypothetical protein RR348_00015 [Clostridia bacterium]